MEPRGPFIDAVLARRGNHAFTISAITAIVAAGVGTLFVWPWASRGGDSVHILMLAVLIQLVSASAAMLNSTTRFAKRHLDVDQWPLLALTGTGPRLASGIWLPPIIDGLLEFALLAPLIALLGCVIAVEPLKILLIELNAVLWLFPLCCLGIAQTFVGMRGALGYQVSQQFRWIIPVAVLMFGFPSLSKLAFLLPGTQTPWSSWLFWTFGGVLATTGACVVWRAFLRRFLSWAGDDFGFRVSNSARQKISLPKILGGKTTRPSRLLRWNRPIFERELRAMLRGLPGVVLGTLIAIGGLAVLCPIAEAAGLVSLSKGTAELCVWVRWVAICCLHVAGLLIALSIVQARFDAECKEQTFTSLLLAIPARKFVYQTVAAILLVTLIFHVAGWLLDAAGVLVDGDPARFALTSVFAAAATITSGYLCLVGTATRIRFGNWWEQILFPAFAICLLPVAIFVVPAVIVRTCDRLEEDPHEIERGMSRRLKAAMKKEA